MSLFSQARIQGGGGPSGPWPPPPPPPQKKKKKKKGRKKEKKGKGKGRERERKKRKKKRKGGRRRSGGRKGLASKAVDPPLPPPPNQKNKREGRKGKEKRKRGYTGVLILIAHLTVIKCLKPQSFRGLSPWIPPRALRRALRCSSDGNLMSKTPL